jgi:hypothetical protein
MDADMNIPDGVPAGYNGETGQTPVQIGLDEQNALILLKVGEAPMIGLPCPVALQLAHNLNAKALQLLFMPPPEMPQGPEGGPPEPPGLVLP